MKLFFKRIKIHNFMSVGNKPVEYDYKPGLNIVMGKNKDTMSNNGSGKTSIIISALTFGLFGKVPRKIIKDDLVNSTNGSGTVIEIEFEKNKDTYIIRRGISPRFISIDKNGEEMPSESTLHLDQKRIQEILEIDYHTFLHTIFTCVNYTQPFLELGKSEKRGVIEDILGISVFGKMFETVHTRYSKSKSTYDKLYSNIKHLTKLIEERDKHINSLKAEEKVFNDKKAVKISTLKQESSLLRKSIIGNKKFAKKKEGVLVVKNKIETDLKSTGDTIKESGKDLAILDRLTTDKKKNIKSLLKENKCDKCTTPITTDIIKKHIKNTKIEIGKNETLIVEFEKSIKENERIKKALTTKLCSIEDKLQEIIKIEYQLTTETDKLVALKKKLKEIENEEFNVCGFVNMDEQKGDIKTLDELQKTFINNEKRFKYSEFSRSLLSEKGVKSYIIRQILPFLNRKVNEYLKKMSVTFSIKFDEELKEDITFNYKKNFKYANFSGGEKKRIDLALMLTLLDISQAQSVVECNLQILDEVIDTSLDSVGVGLFQEILREKIAENPEKSIYIITHRSEINAESYDRIVRIVKERGFSKIDEEI